MEFPTLSLATLTGQSARNRISIRINSMQAAQNVAEVLIAICFFVLLLAPRGAHTCFIIASACLCVPFVMRKAFQCRLRTTGLQWPILIFAAYLIIAALFSPDPTQGIILGAGTAAVILIATAVFGMVSTTANVSWARALSRASARSIALGALLLTVDLATNQALTTQFLKMFPFLTGGSTRHVIMQDSDIVGVYSYVLNRNVGALNLVFWPALAILVLSRPTSFQKSINRICVFMLIMAVTTATFLSDHESSKVALIFGFITFLSASFGRRTFRLVCAAWIAACLLVVPVTHVAALTGLDEQELLTKSARGRVLSWNVISQQISEAPLFGIGLDGTRHYADTARSGVCDIEEVACGTGRHPHNAYLQIWYELGAVGVLFFITFGISILLSIRRLSSSLRPYALATFISVSTMMAFSWSIWQFWFCSSMASAAILIALTNWLIRSESQLYQNSEVS